MNKKFLVLTTFILLATVMATPLVAFVQASKEVIPFTYTFSGALLGSGEGDVNWTPDYSVRIASGTWRKFTYNGPLGKGTYYSEAIISITHYDNETAGYTTYHGHGIYRLLYNITEGHYGAGTVEGISHQEWNYDYQRTPKNLLWGNATLQHGTGELKGVKMVYDFKLGIYTGEIILP